MDQLVVWRPTYGEPELGRALTAVETANLEARKAALEVALEPFDDSEDGDRPRVESVLAAMLAGFLRNRQHSDVDILAMIASSRMALHEFPAWAIEQACLRIARGQVPGIAKWAPTDAEIAIECRSIVAKRRRALAKINKALTAVPPFVSEPVEKRVQVVEKCFAELRAHGWGLRE